MLLHANTQPRRQEEEEGRDFFLTLHTSKNNKINSCQASYLEILQKTTVSSEDYYLFSGARMGLESCHGFVCRGALSV